MGADLHLTSVYQEQLDKYQSELDKWIDRRDAYQQAGKTAEAKAAQQQVEMIDNKLNARGYFRDSYNSSNLLWMFELSWWGDVLDKLTNDEGWMSPANAWRLLEMMQEKETLFEEKLQQLELDEDESQAEVEAYFRQKYERLKAFLQEGIDRKEAIHCWL